MAPYELAFFAAIVASNEEESQADAARLVAWVEAAGGGAANAEAALSVARARAGDPDRLSFLDGVDLEPRAREALIRDGLILACANGVASVSERALLAEASRRLGTESPTSKLARAAAAPVVGGVDLARAHREDIEDFDGPAYFRTLAAVAVADGRASTEEGSRFAVLLQCAGVDAGAADALLAEARANVVAPFAHLPSGLSDAFKQRLFRDATALALADDARCPAEDKVLGELADILGLAPEAVVPGWVWKAAGGVAAAPAGVWLLGAGSTVVKAVGMGVAAGVSGFLLPAVLIGGAGVGSLILSLSRQEAAS
jgi:uncharacterized tellurite resistance protein B-like protein